MVAGHLQEKNGNFYIVLNYTNHEGKRKSKWITTGLTIKGNKKRAQDLLVTGNIKYANFSHQKGTSFRQKVYHLAPHGSPLSSVVC